MKGTCFLTNDVETTSIVRTPESRSGKRACPLSWNFTMNTV